LWVTDHQGHTATALAGGKVGVLAVLNRAGKESSPLLYDVKNFMVFTSVEEKELSHTSRFISPNPRKIKRILNVYAIVRQLASPTPAFRQRLVKWIILCEQWPLHVAVLLQALGDDLKVNEGTASMEFKATMPLHEVYAKVKWLVHDLRQQVDAEAEDLRRRHEKLVSLDGDGALFERMLFLEPVRDLLVGHYYGISTIFFF